MFNLQVNNEPIHMAADHGHTDIVKLILNYGIDLNVIGQVRNLIDTSALIYSSRKVVLLYILHQVMVM